MKSWILALAPWMVAASVAAQSDGPRPADVVFTHYGKVSTTAWQIGEDCYVPAEAVVRWGWKAKVGKTDVTLTADDRTAVVPLKVLGGRSSINLGLAARKFGAGGEWKSGTGTYVVFALVRAVAVRDGVVSVDSTLPIKPKLSFLDGPPRLILDFGGAKLDSKAKQELSPDSRVGMFEPTVFRIVIETSKRPEIPPHQIRPSRDFEFNYGAAPEAPVAIDPKTIDQGMHPTQGVGDYQSTINDFGSVTGSVQDPLLVPSPSTRVGPPIVLSSTDRRIVLQFKPTSKLMSTPQVKRLESNVVELTLPGALFEGEIEFKLDLAGIRSTSVVQGPASTIFTFVLDRPMGIEISNIGANVNLSFVIPKIGDGKLSSKTVVVDAGHGGHDGGAKAPDGSALEKRMTLSIAKLLSDALVAEGAVVVMTRTDDTFVPLKERPAIATRTKADFFISVHINSNAAGRTSTGGMTFYHANDPISQLLAECVQTQIAKVSKLKNLGAWSDSRIYDIGFAVLRLATMPAVLIEMGFINNPNDRARMLTKEFQEQVASAIVKGLKVYLGEKE